MTTHISNKHAPIVVITTCPNEAEANAISERLLLAGLAACVQQSTIRSQYSWQGKLETSTEIKLEIKTAQQHFAQINESIVLHSSYDCPEVIAIEIMAISESYSQWLQTSVN